MNQEKKHKGFTLIELLVVIAIIGILAAVVLSALGSARAKARDARREADIKSIQNALEVYYVENGKYPSTNKWVYSSNTTWGELETLMDVTLPIDPVNDAENIDHIRVAGLYSEEGLGYAYYSSTNGNFCQGQAYMLVYNKETSDGTGPTDGVVTCGNSYTYSNAFVVGVSPMQ